MKRYWLFAYENNYPSGGLSDIFDTYDEILSKEAIFALPGMTMAPYDTIEIFDSVEKKIIISLQENKLYIPVKCDGEYDYGEKIKFTGSTLYGQVEGRLKQFVKKGKIISVITASNGDSHEVKHASIFW